MSCKRFNINLQHEDQKTWVMALISLYTWFEVNLN